MKKSSSDVQMALFSENFPPNLFFICGYSDISIPSVMSFVGHEYSRPPRSERLEDIEESSEQLAENSDD